MQGEMGAARDCAGQPGGPAGGPWLVGPPLFRDRSETHLLNQAAFFNPNPRNTYGWKAF
jgi:hypothetical protein